MVQDAFLELVYHSLTVPVYSTHQGAGAPAAAKATIPAAAAVTL